MTSDIAERKFSVALKTAWGAAVALVLATAAVVAGALRLDATVRELAKDHYGLGNQTRWAQTLATWEPQIAVPDPQDVAEGRASIRAIEIPRARGGP